jgi:hypothetical protein
MPLGPVKKQVTYFTSSASQCGIDRLLKIETESDFIREHQKRLSAMGNAAKAAKAAEVGKGPLTEQQIQWIEASHAVHGENWNRIALDVFHPGPNKPKVAKGSYRKKIKDHFLQK